MVYDAGFGGTAETHATTLVEIDADSGSIWIVQDAFFNFTYIQANGQAIAFTQLIGRLANRQDHLVSKLQSSNQSDWLHRISAQKDRSGKASKSIVRRNFKQMMIPESNAVQLVNTRLAEAGFPQRWDYLLLFPLTADSALLSELEVDSLFDFVGTATPIGKTDTIE